MQILFLLPAFNMVEFSYAFKKSAMLNYRGCNK